VKSAAEIVSLRNVRRKERGPLIQAMEELKGAYKGEWALPLPELDREERVSVAILVNQAVDALGQRIASTTPDVQYPPTKPDQKKAETYARIRRSANLAWWEQNRIDLKMARRARHYVGYGVSPVVLRPNSQWGAPEWQVRDPLSTLPGPTTGADDFCPDDAIFCMRRTVGWLEERYPIVGAMSTDMDEETDEQEVDLVEYVDAEEWVLIAISLPSPYSGEPQLMELSRVPNRTGMCPAVVPGRITLDEPEGQFNQMLGMYMTQAKLMALEVIAVQKGIFPDTWVIGREGMSPEIVRTANGLTGEVGVLVNGALQTVQEQPGYLTNPTLDRLERAQRLTGRIPSEWGGESASNIRTGRRGDAVLSAVVDFPVQEAQRSFARSLEEENKRAVAIAKAYFGDQPRSFYVSWKGARGPVDYTPNVHFDSDENRVSYSHPGADINNLVIGLGQRLGMGTISQRRFMELDPLVEDYEREHDHVIAENLEQALLQAISQQAAQGAIPPADVARIMELVRADKLELAAAVTKVQEEAQARQATPAPAGAPETMPGLAQPGVGAEQPVGPIGEPPAGLANLSQLLGALRRPAMALPQEQGQLGG
jgi:hypothetical protein